MSKRLGWVLCREGKEENVGLLFIQVHPTKYRHTQLKVHVLVTREKRKKERKKVERAEKKGGQMGLGLGRWE